MAGIDDRLAFLEGVARSHDESIALLRMEIGIFTPPITSLEAQIFHLTGMMQRFAVATELRFVGIERRLDGMDKRFDGIDQRLDGMNKRFDSIEGMLQQLLDRS